MIEQLILLSGPIAVGKTTLAKNMERIYDFSIFNTRDILVQSVGEKHGYDRRNLQIEGELLDKETKGQWVVEELEKTAISKTAKFVIVDSVRIKEQVESAREIFKNTVKHVHLTASQKTLESRYKQRDYDGKGLSIPYNELKQNTTENQIEQLAILADVVINTDKLDAENVLKVISAKLNLV